MIALPFFVLTTTGSPEKTGLVALAEMLPLVVLKVLGGPIIDRVGARRVAITLRLGVGGRGRCDPVPVRRGAPAVPGVPRAGGGGGSTARSRATRPSTR